MAEIDFLKASKNKEFAAAKRIALLRIGSLIALVIYCLLVFLFIAFSVYLKNQNTKINTLIETKKQRITELKKIESLHVLAKQRLSVLSKFLSEKHPNYVEILDYLNQSSSSDLRLDSIKIDTKGIVATGWVNNALNLSLYLNNLISSPKITEFSKAQLTNAYRQKNGNYSFSISFEVNGEKKI